MAEQDRFIFCTLFDGKGSVTDIRPEDISSIKPEDGVAWLHLEYTQKDARQWLLEQSGLSAITTEALLADETRPRVVAADKGLLITLRGVNRNPGSEPDDMVSLRLWMNESRIITMRRQRVEAINDIRTALTEGDGPASSGEFLVMLVDRLTRRISDVADEIDDGVDALEEQVIEKERTALRTKLSSYRRMIIGLRRYIVPQKETLGWLYTERALWLDEHERLQLREIAERTVRIIEDLDAARDRAVITQEELNNRLTEQMNRTIYSMSIVATIFLPLGLLTGLLGINVGGIPGAETPWAFKVVCSMLLVIALLEYLLFRRKHIL
jgi:zinc transporter